MSDQTKRTAVQDFLQGKISRTQLLAALAAGAGTVAFPRLAEAQTTPGTAAPYLQFPYFPQIAGRYETETVTDIVSNILTFAYFETTGATFILNTPSLVSTLGLTGLPLAFLQAFDTELQAHIDFWSNQVPLAKPQTTTFTIDPKLVPGPKEALALFEVAATLRIGLMVTAVREFAELGQPTLAKNAAQQLGMYAEERAITRVLEALAGVSSALPPNNKAFETDLFLYTRDAVALLAGLGFIGGSGVPVTYPGRGAVLAAAGATAGAVVQTVPNNATSSITPAGPADILSPRT